MRKFLMIARPSRPALDSFDKELLVALQEDNRTPLRLLAERVHLSVAAVQRRVRRLEEEGVIAANVAVVSPDRVGQGITLLVEVHAEKVQSTDLNALKTLMGNCGYSEEDGERAIREGHADLVAYGRPCITNPDLVARFAHRWPLNDPADPTVWSAPGAEGYTSFPAYNPA